MYRIIATAFFLFISSAVFAKNYLYILGAGGEPLSKSSTIFDDDIKLSGEKFANNAGWEVNALINGGHSQTEKMIKESYKRARRVNDFTAENYNKYMEELIQKIEQGEIKQGDQIVLQINTHGNRQKTKGEEAGHSFMSKSNVEINSDYLKKITSLAKQKKIDTAILDFSCYSGATQELSNEYTCVISASGEFNVAFVNTPYTFTRHFIQNLGNNKSLEENFLQSRTYNVTRNPDFPTISTETGTKLYSSIYLNIYKYFSFYSDQVQEYIIQPPYCATNTEIPALIWLAEWTKIINSHHALNPQYNVNGEMEQFIQTLKKYHQTLLNIKTNHKFITENYKDKNEKIFSRLDSKDFIEVSKKAILSMNENSDFEKAITAGKMLPPFSGQKEKNFATKLDYYQQMKVLKHEYEKINLEDKKFIESYENLKVQMKSLSKMAYDLGLGERFIYQNRYKSLSASSSNNKNHICRRFKL